MGIMFIFTGSSPLFLAVSIPRRTTLISPPLVISLNLSGLSESRLTLTLSTPDSMSFSAYFSSRMPFVVMLRSSMPGIFLLRKSGS